MSSAVTGCFTSSFPPWGAFHFILLPKFPGSNLQHLLSAYLCQARGLCLCALFHKILQTALQSGTAGHILWAS